jgi:hypothetical protein
MALIGTSLPGQEALRNSREGQAAAEARRAQPDSSPYNFKSGDFRLLVVPTIGLDWNDNINISKTDRQDDFILKPLVQFNLGYPITENNVLNLNVGVGYDKYFQHDELDSWRVTSGSELSFDMFVKDFWINFHDRCQFSQDSATESAVANTAEYGTINNTVGVLATWKLKDISPSLGYDHANVISPADQFSSQDRASEMIVGRVGFDLHPQVTAGFDSSVSFTAYNDPFLNDNTAYTVGVFADWRPGAYFRIQPRFGYTVYQFQQTAQTNRTSDLNSWYIDVTAKHDFSDVAGYSFSVGHEIRLGIQSDVNEVWYLRPSLDWRFIKNTNLQVFLSYEHAKQGVANITGNLTETYDWLGTGLSISHALTDRFSLALNYRFTLRSSDIPASEYNQNVVGLSLTYQTR